MALKGLLFVLALSVCFALAFQGGSNGYGKNWKQKKKKNPSYQKKKKTFAFLKSELWFIKEINKRKKNLILILLYSNQFLESNGQLGEPTNCSSAPNCSICIQSFACVWCDSEAGCVAGCKFKFIFRLEKQKTKTKNQKSAF